MIIYNGNKIIIFIGTLELVLQEDYHYKYNDYIIIINSGDV